MANRMTQDASEKYTELRNKSAALWHGIAYDEFITAAEVAEAAGQAAMLDRQASDIYNNPLNWEDFRNAFTAADEADRRAEVDFARYG